MKKTKWPKNKRLTTKLPPEEGEKKRTNLED